MAVPAGRYTVTISVPASPLPLVYHDVQVQEGKTVDLAIIMVPSEQTGRAALTGRITPKEARIALYHEGRERASVSTDREGKFMFTELPAGSYTMEARAPGYATEAVSVNVVEEKTAQQNVQLLFASVQDNVDWASGKIRVRGVGLPPQNASNPTIRRELAARAALSDAERKLLKAVSEIKVGPDQTIRSRMG